MHMSYTVFDTDNPYAQARLPISEDVLKRRSHANRISRLPVFGQYIAGALYERIDRDILDEHRKYLGALARIQKYERPEKTVHPTTPTPRMAHPAPVPVETKPFDYENDDETLQLTPVEIARRAVDAAFRESEDPEVREAIAMLPNTQYRLND